MASDDHLEPWTLSDASTGTDARARRHRIAVAAPHGQRMGEVGGPLPRSNLTLGIGSIPRGRRLPDERTLGFLRFIPW